ncbi:YraN family protein [Streptomyces blastmyceticus]|uniref:YraN family protein n=1 Tax=Streptomyces blastmyceticus TaxID=68180 RepID=UPI003CD099A8
MGSAGPGSSSESSESSGSSRAAGSAGPSGEAGPSEGAGSSEGFARQALGRYGEELAVRRLTEAGIRILDRNWRCRDGEIDIVASDGDALVVCEVKTRRAGAYEHPMAAVRTVKADRLRRLAGRWLERNGGPPPGGVRIDLVGVVVPDRGAPFVEHAKGVA